MSLLLSLIHYGRNSPPNAQEPYRHTEGLQNHSSQHTDDISSSVPSLALCPAPRAHKEVTSIPLRHLDFTGGLAARAS